MLVTYVMRLVNRAQTAWHREEQLRNALEGLTLHSRCAASTPGESTCAPSTAGQSTCLRGSRAYHAEDPTPAEPETAVARRQLGAFRRDAPSVARAPARSSGGAGAQGVQVCSAAYRRSLFRQIVLRSHPDKGHARHVSSYRRAVNAKNQRDTLDLMIIARALSIDLRIPSHFHCPSRVESLERDCVVKEHRVGHLQAVLAETRAANNLH